MITTLKNDEGLIYAYMEWLVVDENGQQNSKGHYLYVIDSWIHEKYRDGRVFQRLQLEVLEDEATQGTTEVYWENRKRGDRPVEIISKERIKRGFYAKNN